ncbi:MAG TPA: deoxyguanosinetriphosphate triphosphohydrolase [Clostridiales bacterium]|nr:deoxyguanosinetriphosphate triphosphohydrolase [Clostridiales bacterium]
MDNIPRIRTEQFEKEMLSQYAALSINSKGRKYPEEQCNIRTVYQRDRDRIIHCKAFRRLKRKTQVFLSPEGDHYRTRLTHTLEVSQIARTIARALRLNEDLTEAIALGHDLGHTPFGHAGERAINECASFEFKHYEQSVRVCEKIENSGKGLNLTYEVLDGIRNHTTGNMASTLEGRVVRFADKIAYINHDIEDAIRANIITENDISEDIKKALGDTKSKRINTLVLSVINNSEDDIRMDPDTFYYFNKIRDFLFQAVYFNPQAKAEESKVSGIIWRLFEYFTKNPDKLPSEYNFIRESEGAERAAVDYIAGMTDQYAIHTYTNLFIPKAWKD